MGNELSKEEIFEVASVAAGNEYKLIKNKQILAESRLETGETIALCTPYSKYHEQGLYWTDITSVQYEVLNSYDTAIVIFRLQGRKMVMVHWDDLKKLFTTENMRYNKNEGSHWKINILDNRIRVGTNDNTMQCKIVKYSGEIA